MRTLLKLAIALLGEHPIRVLLTSVATIAATTMVLWVVSGYEALLKTFDEYANKALGRYTLVVAPISVSGEKPVPAEVVQELRADPAVAAADPMWVRPIVVETSLAAAATNPHLPEAMLLGIDSPQPPFPMARGRWVDPGRGEALEAALGAETARRLGIDVGGEVFIGRGGKRCSLRVVGIVEPPSLEDPGVEGATRQLASPSAGGIYVPMALAERIVGLRAAISFVGVAMKPGADLTRFRFGWAPRLNRYATPVHFLDAFDVEEALDETASAENVKLQSFAATGIAMLVALLVVFGALSMGVSERVRQFAVLRAVVLTRSQVALLVATESLVLASVGFLGGLLVGKSLLWAAEAGASNLLRHGAVTGVRSILLAALAAYGGALLAALVPAYRATRVRPLDAIAPRPRLAAGGRSVRLGVVVAGLALVSVNPLLTFVFPPGYGGRIGLSMSVGFTAMAVGFVLLAPAVVAWVERLVGPVLARILGLDPKLLANQMTSNLWRIVGAAIALSVGLGLYVAIQVWGFTMLDSFVPGRWAPDALVAFSPDGIAPAEAQAAARFPGVDASRCVPIVVEQPRLREDITGSGERASVTRQDNVVIIGLDPKRALGGVRPLLELDWVQGSAAEAIARLEKGRACVVPDHFLRETGLNVGDGFDLVPPEDSDHPVRYTIAGSVRLPGWHWQTKLTGFRARTHRAAALMFSDYASVARDFALPKASHVWLAYDAPQPDLGKLAAAAQALYRRVLQRDVAIDSAPGRDPYVRVMPVEGVRAIVRGHAKQWIWAMSMLPLVGLVIACAGVLNVILASVRARRWEMGVLRAIGFTRSTLVRMVIAEGLLIGIVAAALSIGFGIVAGWCGTGISQYISFFGGLNPPLVVPWTRILLGLLATLTLCAAAALAPALSAGRTQPAVLLQAGRGTM